MYYQKYMQEYYLSHKEKIKKQSIEWREKNINRVKAIQSRYRKKHGSICGDFREERIEVLPFEQRVSPEVLLKMKENTLINQKYIKNYTSQENRFIIEIKKKILEGK